MLLHPAKTAEEIKDMFVVKMLGDPRHIVLNGGSSSPYK